MALIDIDTGTPQQNRMRRNFEGPRLICHKIQYTIADGQRKTAIILAENFPAAAQLLADDMKGHKFHIDAQSDSEFEICAMSPAIEKGLYRALQNKYDPIKRKMIRR